MSKDKQTIFMIANAKTWEMRRERRRSNQIPVRCSCFAQRNRKFNVRQTTSSKLGWHSACQHQYHMLQWMCTHQKYFLSLFGVFSSGWSPRRLRLDHRRIRNWNCGLSHYSSSVSTDATTICTYTLWQLSTPSQELSIAETKSTPKTFSKFI